MNKIRTCLVLIFTALMFLKPEIIYGESSDSIMSITANQLDVVHRTSKTLQSKLASGADRLATDISNGCTDTVFKWEDSDNSITDSKASDSTDDDNASYEAVAFIVILLAFPLIGFIAVVWCICYFLTKKNRDQNKLIAMAIERGVQFPPIYDQLHTKSRLQSGLVWIAWGMGLLLCLLMSKSPSMAMLSFIPLLVGVAKLITYFVEDRPKKRD